MSNGILGLRPPSGGPRDITGTAAARLANARERCVKAGRPVSTLTLADLEAEAVRWETRQAARAQEREAERESARVQRKAFLAQLRSAEVGQVIGPDENGCWWQLTAADDLVEVPAP